MKRLKPLAAIVIALSVLLTGCATGNTSISEETNTTLQQKLIRGKTTQAEVLAQFGEPSERGSDDGKAYWAYQMATSSAKTFIPFASVVSTITGSSGISGKYLRIFFNKKGVVESYDLNETRI